MGGLIAAHILQDDLMAAKINDMWLKVLIGFLIMSILAIAGSKLDKDTFNRHERYERQQFDDIKSQLDRIENKL